MQETLYDKLGISGTLTVAVQATPAYAIPLLPLTYFQFSGILQRSKSVEEFKDRHIHLKDTNWFYNAFRPQGRQVIRILKEDYAFS